MRRLDPLLDRLEDLALADVQEVPADLAEQLAAVGISAGKIIDAHEAVLELQARLQPPAPPDVAAYDALVELRSRTAATAQRYRYPRTAARTAAHAAGAAVPEYAATG